MGRRISEGRTFKVTVPESTTIEQGKFYLLDGILGMAVQSVETGAGETAEVVLNAEPGEYETSQVDTNDTFAKGSKVYWDDINKRFTTVATDGFFCGIVTQAKDANNVVWLWFAPQQASLRQAAAQADSTAADVAALVADFNSLLAKLRAANLIASS